MGERAASLFRERFGTVPELLAVAPGRVNLIGEHTDYSGGFVFPAAIDRQLFIAASLTSGPTSLFSEQLGEGEIFGARDVLPGQVEGWAKYPAGVAWALRELGHRPPNLKAAVLSDVPIGSGISSSAALELAFAVAWNELGGFGLSNVELAKLGQQCENGFVGVASGIMDQMASAMGRSGHAMFLDTRSLHLEYAPIPNEATMVICDTGKPRALTDSAYNERRTQCEAAATALGVALLRDATFSDLITNEASMDPVVFRRARHVVTENRRCSAFKQALGDRNFDELGRLMRASHESLRDDYEVSSPALDAMAGAAQRASGCIGARMTGAGFGGACIALVEVDLVANFVSEVSAAYTNETMLLGRFVSCEAVEGARRL